MEDPLISSSFWRQRRWQKLPLKRISLLLVVFLCTFLVWLYSENSHKRDILQGIHHNINKMTHSFESLEQSGKELDSDITNLKQEIAMISNVNTNSSII